MAYSLLAPRARKGRSARRPLRLLLKLLAFVVLAGLSSALALLAFVAFVATGATPVARADGGAPNLVYVAGAGAQGGDVAVIDIGQRKETGHISVGGDPSAIVLSRDSRYAYVARAAKNDVAVVDAHAQQVTGSIAVGKTPDAMAIDLNPNDPLIYVANSGSNSLSVIDSGSQRVLATVPVGAYPDGVAVTGTYNGVANPGDPEIYVANRDANTVSVISSLRRVVIATISAPGGPLAVTIPGTGNVAYVTTRAGTVLGLNISNHQLLGTILQKPGDALGTMDYDALTGQVYVPDATANVVYILTPAAAGPAGTPTIPPEPARVLQSSGGPVAVAITFEGSFGFVAQRSAGMVSVYDAARHQLLGTVSVGGAPRAMVTGAYPPLLSSSSTLLVDLSVIGLIVVLGGAGVYTVWRADRKSRNKSKGQPSGGKSKGQPSGGKPAGGASSGGNMTRRTKPKPTGNTSGASGASGGASRGSGASLRLTMGPLLALCLGLALLAGCAPGGSGAGDPSGGAYGGSINHTHDLLALRGAPGTVLLASHIGLYRTTDSGKTWSEAAGGAGQPMDGLMIFKLAQSSVDLRRVYVLAIPRTEGKQPSPPGLYTSDDAGASWKLATPFTAMPTQSIFSIGAGAAQPQQVFAVLPALGTHGLYESDDAGGSWHALPPTPTTSPSGVLADPAHPGRLFLWSYSTGCYESADGGQTWQTAPTVQGGVYSVSTAGQTVYVSAGAGLYVSQDDGASFTLVDQTDTFSAVLASGAAPQHAYALAGTAVYRTQDGGKTWTQTAATGQHPGVLAVSPDDATTAYVALSYPLGVERTTDGGAHWQTVLP